MKKPIEDVLARFRVTGEGKFRLKHYDPDDTAGYDVTEAQASRLLARGVQQLAEQQDRLYAQDRWSVLCIFQAMDAAGKDGVIKHVFTGVNPQGCHVTAFKAPTAIELDHDFLWRHVVALPERGRIGIHNRSWYEEVLVARVHPAILEAQRLPPRLMGKRIFDERLEDIAGFERYLGRQGTVVLKFFLHLGRDEQKKRFLQRIDEPEKNWKFNAGDVTERSHWDAYHAAYEAAIRATATPAAPWYIVPANHKAFTRLVVVAAIVAALQALDLRYPKPSKEELRRLQEARETLTA
jgi:PPK2 family polyphosphate:nucleotide phosphotransferase